MIKKNFLVLVGVSFLFFLFGFLTTLNGILIPHFKKLFHLNYVETMLIQFSFFSAYFVFSIPSGRIVRSIGYVRGICVGLVVTAMGSSGFLLADYLSSYPLFLLFLFIMASGVTILQVAANPYAALIGSPETAHSRMTLVQAFNSIGTTSAPLVGSYFILKAHRESFYFATSLPYGSVAIFLFLLCLCFIRLEGVQESIEAEETQAPLAFPKRRVFLGVFSLFCYVGAEVGIGSMLIPHMEEAWSIDAAKAGNIVSIYWFLSMLGRLSGVYILKKYKAPQTLFYASFASSILSFLAIFTVQSLSPYFLIAVGLFNSVQFPLIFSLSIENLGSATSRVSSYLCMAIVGGAIVPLMQGFISDFESVRWSFLVPSLAYLFISYFAFFCFESKNKMESLGK